VLLNTLLGSLEQSFSAMPGKKIESGSDHYHYLGMQTLASSLAAGGGVGIAKLIVRSLERSEPAGVSDQHEKSLTRGASLGRPF
jgi:Rod binding domain-containing protein